MQSKMSSPSGSCNFAELLAKENQDVMENGGMSYSSEDVVGVDEKSSSITFGRKKQAAKLIVIGIIIALSIACICLGIVLVIQTQKIIKSGDKTSENVCYSSQCLKVASILLRDMNKSVDPCKQFMKFSCDGWVNNNPIDEGEDEQGSMFKLSIMNNQKLRYLVESLGQFGSSHPMFKVKNYYSSCMNEDAIEQHSRQDFQTLIDRLVKWPVLDPAWADSNPSWSWVDKLAHIHSNVFKTPLISLNMMVNPKDTKAYVFQVSLNFLTFNYKQCTLPK